MCNRRVPTWLLLGTRTAKFLPCRLEVTMSFWGCLPPFLWCVKVPTSIPTMNDLVRSPRCRWGHRIVFGALPEIISMSKRVLISTPTIDIANITTPGPRINFFRFLTICKNSLTPKYFVMKRPSSTKAKSFDAVKMMRQIRDQISRDIAHMDYKQIKEYFKTASGQDLRA